MMLCSAAWQELGGQLDACHVSQAVHVSNICGAFFYKQHFSEPLVQILIKLLMFSMKPV